MNPQLFDQLPCGLLVTDLSGMVVESNAFMCTLVDEQAGIPAGTSIDRLFTPASRVFLQTHVWPTIVRSRCMSEVFLELAGAESRRRPVLVNLQQSDIGGRQQIVWVFVVTEERHRFEAALIQARKRAEEAARLRAEHELFTRTVTDAIPGLVSYWDRDLMCRFANTEFAAAVAARTSSVLGTPMQMLVSGDSVPLRMELAQLTINGAAQQDEQVQIAHDGTLSAVEVTYVPHRVGGDVAGVLIVMRDIAEMKRTELALRTEVHERAVAETIAHERGRVMEEAQRLGQIGSWHWQVDGDVVTWSAELYRMLGRNPAFPAPAFAEQSELYTAESMSRLHVAVAACLRTRAPYTLELQYTLPDGSHGWLEARGEAEYDAFGAVTGLRGTVQEISARQALTAQLAEQHERLRVTMQSIGDAVITTDAEGHITWLNPVAERMTGWSVAEAVGRPAERVIRIVHELTGEAMESPFDRSRTTGGRAAASRSTRLIARDGSTRAIDDSASSILSDAGLLLGVVVVLRDITEQRIASEHVRLANAALEEAQALALTGSWEFDLETGTITWSRQLYALFGRDEANGPPGFDAAMAHYADEDERRLRAAVAQVAEHGTVYDMVLRLAGDVEAPRFIRVRGEARRGAAGTVVGLVGTATDVTQDVRRQRELEAAILRANDMAQRAEAANEAKSQFLANMSHEIRTPLTAILGFADIIHAELSASDEAARARAATVTIRRAGQHLLTVINDILDLSRIEAGGMTIEPVETNLVELLLEIDSMMRARTGGQGIVLGTTLETAIPERVVCDATRVRQILMNLVGNAVKFTAKGSVTIRVATVPIDDRLALRIAIEDTGIGLSEEQAGRLFAPFAQADASVTRQFGGSGLGLVISRRLAGLMGGSVHLDSSMIGVGSRFVFEVPVDVVPGAALTQALHVHRDSAPADVPAAVLTGRILLVEDGEDNQFLIAHFLRHAGAEVTITANGAEALAAMRDAAHLVPFDLVISDIQMPVMDGYSLVRQLRAEGITVPIIALTAHAMAEDRRRCLDAGCDDFTTKPIDRVVLVTMVNRWLAAGDAVRRQSPTSSSEPVRGESSGTALADAPLVSALMVDPSMSDLVTQFVSRLPSRVEAMEAAMEAGDHAMLASLAHQMKGAAGSYGFPAMTESARDLERFTSGGGTVPECRSALQRLRHLCDRAVAGVVQV